MLYVSGHCIGVGLLCAMVCISVENTGLSVLGLNLEQHTIIYIPPRLLLTDPRCTVVRFQLSGLITPGSNTRAREDKTRQSEHRGEELAQC